MPIQKVNSVIVETPTVDDDQFKRTGVIRSDGFAVCAKNDRVKQVQFDPSPLATDSVLTIAGATGGSSGTVVLPASGSISNASFKTVQTDSGTSPQASSPTDALTITSSDKSVDVNGNSSTDTVDIKAVTPTVVSALAIDWSLAPIRYKTLSVNSTFTWTNTGDRPLQVLIISTGAVIIGWPTTTWLTPDGTQPDQKVSGATMYSFTKINGTIYGIAT